MLHHQIRREELMTNQIVMLPLVIEVSKNLITSFTWLLSYSRQSCKLLSHIRGILILMKHKTGNLSILSYCKICWKSSKKLKMLVHLKISQNLVHTKLVSSNRPRAIFFKARLAISGWLNSYASELLFSSTCENQW